MERENKHEEIIERLVEQQIRSEDLVEALKTRTDQHAEEIKEIKKEAVDIGKVLEGMRIRFQIVQWIGIGLGTLILNYLFSNFFKK